MRKYLLLLLLPVIAASCKKNSPPATTPAVTVAGYFPPKAGNYWVYEQFNEDSATGIYTNTFEISDSIYYSNDTNLNGNTYHVFCDFDNSTTSLGTIYSLIWRDSSGYMVDQNGDIELSIQNFTDTLQTYSSFGLTLKYVMVNNVNVSAPDGSFNTIAFKGIFTSSQYFTPGPNYYYSFNYAKDVGLVMYHFFNPHSMTPGGAFERRLIRYHLN